MYEHHLVHNNKERLKEIHSGQSNVYQMYTYTCISILPVGKALFGAAPHTSESIKFKMQITLHRIIIIRIFMFYIPILTLFLRINN